MTQWRRGALLVVLFAGLALSLVSMGAAAPDPAANTYPGRDAVAADPGAYVGDRVSVSGTVVGTDPVVVRIDSGVAAQDVVVHGLDRHDPAAGESLAVFGTLVRADTIEAERAIVRAPRERTYMFAVSVLGGLLVLGRIGRDFRLDREGWTVQPRTDRGKAAPPEVDEPAGAGAEPDADAGVDDA